MIASERALANVSVTASNITPNQSLIWFASPSHFLISLVCKFKSLLA